MTEELMSITIDGEEYEVVEVTNSRHASDLPLLELDDGTEWYLAFSHEAAGQAARKYWKEMAENDPTEFTCMVGEQTLVSWALGQYGGPGSTQVTSLEGWLDLWLDTPEEHFARYDGNMWEPDRLSPALLEELEWGRPDYPVAFRCS
jgi:hypothetical protein